MSIETEPFIPTLIVKSPFFALGVAIGMGIVWVSFQWVPDAMLSVF